MSYKRQTPQPVAEGGTGAGTFSAHSVIVGNSTSALSDAGSMSNGQIVIGSTGAAPVAGSLTTSSLVITKGAGTLAADTTGALQTDTGFATWGGAGNYFDASTLGSFTVLRPGTGFIDGNAVSWTAPQTVSGMTAGNTYYIYVDSTGTIGIATPRSDALYQNYIVLFECMRDSTAVNNQITVKENHPYNYPVATSNYEHQVINTVIENDNNGANITLNGTQKIQINGADVLADHGLMTTIPDSGGSAVTWNQYYTNAGGKWALYTTSDTFTGEYNNSGTPTALSSGHFAVYRLYVSKDNLTTSTPTYFAILDVAQYTSLGNANTAISNGTPAAPTNELLGLELAQLGYIVYRASTSAIDNVVISKATLRSTISSSGTTTAALVTTDTASFSHILSSSNTNVQSCLNTIDGATFSAFNGGTGVSNPTAHTLPIAEGSSAYNFATLTNGELLIGSTSNDPVPATLTAGAGMTITNGAGSISLSSSGTIVTSHTSAGSGNHTFNANTKYIIVYGWGAGSGGGSGRRGASTSAGGGSGGAGGTVFMIESPVSFFGGGGATVPYVVGAGGSGATAQTSDNTDGNVGTAGGITSFGNIFSAISISPAPGGAAGTSGTASAGHGQSSYISMGSLGYIASGGRGATGVGVAGTDNAFTTMQPTGGGGGAGADSGTARQGSTGVNIQRPDTAAILLAGGTGGIESGTINGGLGNPGSSLSNAIVGGTGGGGGGGQSVGSAAGNGGNGGKPGGGGGGGGGSLNGTNSGTGGNGADGALYIIEFI